MSFSSRNRGRFFIEFARIFWSLREKKREKRKGERKEKGKGRRKREGEEDS